MPPLKSAALAKGIAMRVFTILVAVLSATVVSAVSQDQSDQLLRTAKAASPFNEFRSAQWVRVEGANGRRFLAAIMRPKGVGPFPAVVVLHGGDGLNTSYLSLASDLARSGFVVVTGCWQAANTVCSEATPPGEWVADPAAHSGKELIALARSLPKVQADRIGLYGLSRGGHAALWAASTGAHVQAVVADAPAHEPSPMQIYPPPPKPLTVIRDLDAPVLIMHGTSDSVIPAAQSREYESAARNLGKPLVAEYFDGVRHMPSLLNEGARKMGVEFLKKNLLK